MKTTMDSAGRIVIPREIRAAAGLKGGSTVEIGVRDGVIEIEPAPARVKIVRRGKVSVLVYEDDVPPLTTEEINAVRDELRNRRR